MTTPDSSRATVPAAPMIDWWRSRWFAALVPVGLGGVILAAEATAGKLGSGLVWFGVLALAGVLLVFGGRFDSVREALGETEDERDALINTRAMAAAGAIMVVVLTGCIVFELARGDNPSPYTQIVAVGGATYAVSLLVLRRLS
jgi:hypothetical protein